MKRGSGGMPRFKPCVGCSLAPGRHQQSGSGMPSPAHLGNSVPLRASPFGVASAAANCRTSSQGEGRQACEISFPGCLQTDTFSVAFCPQVPFPFKHKPRVLHCSTESQGHLQSLGACNHTHPGLETWLWGSLPQRCLGSPLPRVLWFFWCLF